MITMAERKMRLKLVGGPEGNISLVFFLKASVVDGIFQYQGCQAGYNAEKAEAGIGRGRF